MGIVCFREFLRAAWNINALPTVDQYIGDVGELADYMLQITTAQADKSDSVTGKRVGVYIDMASLLYGVLLTVVNENKYDEGGVKFYTAKDQKQQVSLQDVGQNDQSSVRNVYCVLGETVVDDIAAACSQSLLKRLGPLFYTSHRLYTCWDTQMPVAKVYEQNRRAAVSKIVISRKSRIECYKKTSEKLYDNLVGQYMALLLSTRHQQPLPRPEDREYIRLLVERKMLDCVKTGGGKTGEAEWKCIFQAQDDFEDGAVDVQLFYGNDWDIAMAVILHDDPSSPRMIYAVESRSSRNKRDSDTKRDVDDTCQRDDGVRLQAFGLKNVPTVELRQKAVYFIALCTVGNDYILPLVNPCFANYADLVESTRVLVDYEKAALMCHAVDVCTAAIYSSESVTRTCECRPGNVCGGPITMCQRHIVAKSFAAVVWDMLNRVYKLHDGSSETMLWYATRYQSARFENTTSRSELRDEEDSRDQVICQVENGGSQHFTVQQCFDAFATTTLWYLSYCTFYKNIEKRAERAAFREHGISGSGCSVLLKTSLPVYREFTFDDERMSVTRFKPRLFSLRTTFKQMTAASLFWALENSFYKVLSE